jgi:hypothetical protein
MASGLVQHVPRLQFHLYPSHLLLGVVDAPEYADEALEDFESQGIPLTDMCASFGDDGVAAFDPDGREHGWLARVWRAAQRATGEHQTFEHYADELKLGHICVGVHCASMEAAERAATILQRHRAHYVNYFGPAMIETLRR